MAYRLYLLRHAIAEPADSLKYPDDDRPLSAEGKSIMAKAAATFPKRFGPIDVIYTSPSARTRETAEIVARAFISSAIIKELPDLAIGGSIAKVVEVISNRNLSSLMLVGHEPGLCELAARIVGGVRESFEFRRGTVAKIMVDLDRRPNIGKLEWILHPEEPKAG